MGGRLMSSPLSAFTAIPNPQMPAFLGAQSLIMMYQAREGWQYGKRRISALSNADFNVLTPQSLMERQAMELKGAIPIIENSMKNMNRMIPMIIEQYGDFIRLAIQTMPQFAQNVFGGQVGANLQSNMRGFDDLLKLISKLLPQLPEAEARLVTVEIIKKAVDPNMDPTKFQPPPRPFIGPEINPVTGETNPFVAAVKSLPPPDSHIISRKSNVSIQSLQLEQKHLNQIIRDLTIRLQQEQQRTGQAVTTKRARVGAAFNQLQTAKQNLANFMKMHGLRL